MAKEPKWCRALPHSLYIHIDPGTRDLLYVGISYESNRPREFCARKPAHRERLYKLLAAGWTRDQIVRFPAKHLDFDVAKRLEREVIAHLCPPYNIQHNPNAAPFAGTVAPVALGAVA